MQFHNVLSAFKAEFKYGGGGTLFLLVEKAQVKRKISRKVSSYADSYDLI